MTLTKATPTIRQIAAASSVGWHLLNVVRCDMGELGSREESYSDAMRREMDLALDILAATPALITAARQTLACAQSLNPEMTKSYERLRAALAKVGGEK